MRLKKRKLHELLYTEIGRSGTIRLATGILTYINPHELHITTLFIFFLDSAACSSSLSL